MDARMIIPLPTADTSLQDHPIVVARTTISPISHAKIQDSNLLKDLQPFAIRYSLNLRETFSTETFLHFLLLHRTIYNSGGAASTRIRTAIKILETEWRADIEDWSQNESLSPEDPNTGEVVWNSDLFRLLNLILTPLRSRIAYIFFDKSGNISGKPDTTGIWRECCFLEYNLNHGEKTLALLFKFDNQIKGLILQANSIKKFDDFGIYFQHPTHRDCIIFNPFSCEEFAKPRPGSDQRLREILSEIWGRCVASAREQPSADYSEDQVVVDSPQELTDIECASQTSKISADIPR